MRRFFGPVVVAGVVGLSSISRAQAPCPYYVAPPPAGSNVNPGTAALPWATLDYASATVLPLGGSNCTVFFADGVYSGGNTLYERFPTPITFKAENPYRAVLQNEGRALSLFGARNMIFEGFEFRHSGPGAAGLVVQVQKDGANWAENVTFRNNVFHDSWNNDILKINNGARFITVENNVFYNQSGSDEHMDVNSVTDVVIQDNIFFNDFPGSGRPNLNDTSSFIVIKDSNGNEDGLQGSERIVVRRNVFLNWQGSTGSNFVLIGEDGNPYHEGKDILVENNLMLGNSPHTLRAAFGVKGGRNVTFRNNTVAGDLPSLAFAFRLNQEGGNPPNENVLFHNNLWSDPTATMGAGGGGGNDFSDGSPSETTGLVLDRNLYWNGAAAIPAGDQVNPLVDDARRIVADPLLNTSQGGIVLPRWNGTAFSSGNASVREEFVRLVGLYGAIPWGSPAQNQADTTLSAADDILGRPRSTPDLGAFEVAIPTLSIRDVAVTEGNAGSANAEFTVRLSGGSIAIVTVNGSTNSGTASAGSDYMASSGPLTFTPGSTSQMLSVPILGDTVSEADETFTVNLSGATNAPIADGQAIGTILDDDAMDYYTATPCRAADTRNAPGPSGGPALVANIARAFPVSGRCAIPPTAKAVAVNVAVTGATHAGNLRLYPRDLAVPLT
ncbi:MAG: Calx-beta domain-containing protein, partial [Vicinamibacteria bacterium]